MRIITLILLLTSLSSFGQSDFKNNYIRPDSAVVTVFKGTSGSVDTINTVFQLGFQNLYYVSPGLAFNYFIGDTVKTGDKLTRSYNPNSADYYTWKINPNTITENGNTLYPYVYSKSEVYAKGESNSLYATTAQGIKADAALNSSSSLNPANVSQTSSYRFVTDSEKSTWNTKLSSEVDGSITNEIELPTQTGNSGRTLITNGTNPSWGKRQETYTGTTAGSGTYTVTYTTAYSVTPNVQFNINGGTTTNTARLTASSTTGFTITANNRVEVLGLLPTYPTLNGLVIDILVTEK